MEYQYSNYDETISSPTNQNSKLNCLSTPKINRSINNSKSPFAKLKLKKSKRRECTPAYSPKNEMKETGCHYYTEKKYPEYHRLNFDLAENENNRLSFLNCNEGDLVKNLNFADNQINSIENNNLNNNQPKKKFLSLIEESLNEVSEIYYGVLGSQTTPDTIFNNIFGDEKEKRKSNNKNSLDRIAQNSQINDMISNMLNEIKNKHFNILTQMVYK
jgi:hypothetical protein